MIQERGTRSLGRAAALLLVAALLAACGSGSGGSPRTSVPPISTPTGPTRPASGPATTASTTPDAQSAQRLCVAALSDLVVAWAGATVADFRSYQYGGPTPHRPLAVAFAALAPSTPGAWCGVPVAAQTMRWWAVVPGHDPVRAIDVTGPGEGSGTGAVPGPPRVP